MDNSTGNDDLQKSFGCEMQIVYMCNDDGTMDGLWPAGKCLYCKEIFHWNRKENGVHHPLRVNPDKIGCPNRGKWFKAAPMVEFIPRSIGEENCVSSCTHERMTDAITYF